MEKNKLTKELLAANFHDLMLRKDFEKITIKNITDEAGVIRPTFYYHFQDKYDVLEYVLFKDVFEEAIELIRRKKNKEARAMIFQAFAREREFYRRAFRISGQNSFAEMLEKQCRDLWMEEFRVHPLKSLDRGRQLKAEVVAAYYSVAMANSIRIWIETVSQEISPEEIGNIYEYLISHSVYEMTQN